MIKYIDVYNKALIKLKKEASGRGLRPYDFKQLINQISNKHFDNIYTNYSKDASNTGKIQRFFKDVTLTNSGVDSTSVTYELPSGDFAYHRGIVLYRSNTLSSSSVFIPNYTIDILQDSEKTEALKSYIDRPRSGNEIATIEGGMVVITSDTSFASNPTAIKIPYIRKPSLPSFDYNIVENTNGTATSVIQTNDNGFDFEDEDEEDLVNIVLEIMGVQLKRQDIFQYSQLKQVEDAK